MAYGSLAEFLEELAKSGDLARVAAEVDPQLEVAEITRRVAAAGGPALLFERVRGRQMALVTNLLGSERRLCLALSIDSLAEIASRTEDLIQKNTPQNWFDRLKMSGDEAGINKFRPKTIKSGASQQVVRLGRDVDLAALPLVKQWPGETAAAICGGTMLMPWHASDRRSLARVNLQALDQNRLAAIDDSCGAFTRCWDAYRAAGEKMPAAVILGGDPALSIVTSIELAGDVDPYHFAGLLRGKAMELVKCRTHALEAPAEADLILEGYFDPQEAPVEVEAAAAGASYFRVPTPSPVLSVTAISHRTHAILPAIIDTALAGEAASLGTIREQMLLPAIRAIAPAVVAMHLSTLGGAHRFAFVSIRKTQAFEARQVASALWGCDALRFTKFLVLVDSEIDVHNLGAVLAAVGANVAPERDIFSHEAPAHPSDHAKGHSPLGRHLAIDATAKIAGERDGNWPKQVAPSAEIAELVTARWKEYGL